MMTEIKIKRQLVPFEWLQMPKLIQELFIKWFKISRTGGAIVVDNKIISDGHTNEDLAVVSLESLQAFLHTDETHWDKLLQLTINKMENYVESNPANQSASEAPRIDAGTVGKKRGRPSKKKTA